MKLKDLKIRIKKLSAEIRQMKSERKQFQFGYVPGLDNKRAFVRHLHITYCLLRGRTYEEIENRCREHNEPSKALIDKFMEEYRDEDVRISA